MPGANCFGDSTIDGKHRVPTPPDWRILCSSQVNRPRVKIFARKCTRKTPPLEGTTVPCDGNHAASIRKEIKATGSRQDVKSPRLRIGNGEAQGGQHKTRHHSLLHSPSLDGHEGG